ncbi:MAG: type II toxin-antitoxin system VapC family toxin [Terriglobia bacterium]
MRVFLDTNIFLYAAGRAHPERDACARLLRRVANGSLEATVNTEVVQEILYVLTRRGRRREALVLARSIEALFPDMLPVTVDDMREALRLLEHHSGLSIRDAVHAATMLRNGLATVASVDPDFDRIPGIRRLALASA